MFVCSLQRKRLMKGRLVDKLDAHCGVHPLSRWVTAGHVMGVLAAV